MSVTVSVSMSDSVNEEWLRQQLQIMRRRRGDLANIEVKSAKGGFPRVGETLCAFANMPDGGYLILGVSEPAFEPVGIGNVAQLEAQLANVARSDAFTHPIECHYFTVSIEGKDVLVAQVFPSALHLRPIAYKGVAYLRQADGDYQMSSQEIAQLQLLAQAQRPQYDRQQIEGSSPADLDNDLLPQFLSAARDSSHRLTDQTDETILRRLQVVGSDGQLTMAGVYALGVYPQQYASQLAATAAVQLPRSMGTRLSARQDFDGPLPAMVDDLTQWVYRNSQNLITYREDGNAIDVPEFPPVAIRELITNAFVHRDLSPLTVSKRVEVRLRSDRLIISSPGGLWGVTESQLGRPGGKSAVNPALYDICKLIRRSDGFRLIEGEGGGIMEALQALEQAGFAPPQFIDSGVTLTVILYRTPAEQRRGKDAFPRLTGRDNGHGYDVSEVVYPSEEPAPRAPAAAQSLPSVARDSGPAASEEKLEKAAAATKHGAVIWPLLPASVPELARQTSLTFPQLRFALKKLMQQGLVQMDGGQGDRFTAYRPL